MAIYDLYVQNAIGFDAGAVSSGGNTYAAGNTLNFVQSVSTGLAVVSAETVLFFDQEATFVITRQLSVSNTITFTDQVSRPKDLYVSNVFRFTQEAGTANFQSSNNSLTFTTLAVASRGIGNLLAFTQTTSFNLVKNISASNTLAFLNLPAVVLDSLTPVIVVPTIPAASPVTLIFEALTVVLKSPEFGNVNGISQSRIQMNSRGGDLIIFRDPMWPTTETLKFQFKDLPNYKAKNFLNFIDVSLGQDITLVDYEGVSWTGIITNSQTAATQEGPEFDVACSGFNVEIEFQGTKV